MAVPRDELDFALCVTAGQVFRWGQTGPDRFFGVDGANWYDVQVQGETYNVSTNGTIEDFASLFRLDESLAVMQKAMLQTTPELAPFIKALPGLRVMRPSDVVEETVSFCCTVNNNIARILKMVGVLAGLGPVMDDWNGKEVRRFPNIETVATLDEEFLRKRGFGYRARTIPEIARQICERGGREWLESLKEADYADVHLQLTEIRGIGPKLADCICLFALHHSQAVPVDTHLWQATVRNFFPQWKGKSLTGARYEEVGDFYRAKFGDLAGWAHQYYFYDNMRNWRTYQKCG